jgi:1-acyl-sn-glycerol-3-phosphate acyltransferase
MLGLCAYVTFFLSALVFLPVLGLVTLVTLRDPTRRIRGRWMRRFGKTTSSLTPLWRFRIEGPRPPDIDHRAYVVVSNHESTADPFLLSWLPWDMRWVAKESLFKLPFLGWLMRLGGDIPLRRGDRTSVGQMMTMSARTLAGGLSVMLFPEGTRSPDGQLGPFKDGAFQLAITAQAPILPVVIAGTRQCRPKGSLWFGQARAVARVLEPVPTIGLTIDDVARLRERVRARIADAIAPLRTHLGMQVQSAEPALSGPALPL